MPLIAVSIKLDRIDEGLLYKAQTVPTGYPASAFSRPTPRTGRSSCNPSLRNATKLANAGHRSGIGGRLVANPSR